MIEPAAPRLEVLRNPFRGEVPDRPSRADGRPSQLHGRLPGYAATPLIDVPGLAAKLGVSRLMVKDESRRFDLPAFKMLGASWASYLALQSLLVERTGREVDFESVTQFAHALEPLHPLALASATDGNHGRAVAHFASWVGLGARIFVPAGTSPARIAAIEAEGATCTVVDGTYEDAVARAAQEAGDDCLVISDTSWPGYETVPQWVIEGYETIFEEIHAALVGTRRPSPPWCSYRSGSAPWPRPWPGTTGSPRKLGRNFPGIRPRRCPICGERARCWSGWNRTRPTASWPRPGPGT